MTKNNGLGSKRSHHALAIATLIMPSLLIVFSLAMLAVINLIFNPTFWMTGDTDPVNPTPLVITVLNTFFIVTGATGLISLLPGAAVGTVLLIRSRSSRK